MARGGRDHPEPHSAQLDALVPARARDLPPRPPLPRPAALAVAVDGGHLRRRGLSPERRQHLLALAHPGPAALLRPRLVAQGAQHRRPPASPRLPPVVGPDHRRRRPRHRRVGCVELAPRLAGHRSAALAVLRGLLLRPRRGPVVGRRHPFRAPAPRRRPLRCVLRPHPRGSYWWTTFGQYTMYVYLLHSFVLYPFRESGVLRPRADLVLAPCGHGALGGPRTAARDHARAAGVPSARGAAAAVAVRRSRARVAEGRRNDPTGSRRPR